MRRSGRLRSRDDAVDASDAPAKRLKAGGKQQSVEVKTASKERAAWSSFLREKCFFQPPKPFFDLFELATELRPDRPCDAFADTLGIRLSGPFDLLAAAHNEVAADKPLHVHGRFYSDPPEVTAVMVDCKSDTGGHWGYFRDSPDQAPEYVVHARSSQEGKFDIVGADLFQVLQSRLKERRTDLKADEADELLAKIAAHRGDAEEQPEPNLRRKRSKDSVAASLSQLGIVVPVNAKTNTGYRELPVTGAALEDLLRQVQNEAGKKPAGSARKQLSELITRATIASDECDFGTGLLLGLDLFAVGSAFEKEALQLLRVAYLLLRRAEFYKIASAHCKFRSQDNSVAYIQSIVPKGSEQNCSNLRMIEMPPPLASTSKEC